ncbi:hypothetical protein V1477_016467 [Vespula maculifrons]|uniref:Uncharacterized protein n=1 Tax=Vespula maculifrons TaxID=7453 RepID=A0ABD2B9B0_VESMC
MVAIQTCNLCYGLNLTFHYTILVASVRICKSMLNFMTSKEIIQFKRIIEIVQVHMLCGIMDLLDSAINKVTKLDYSVKPGNFDEVEHLWEFLVHFEFVAKVNCKNESAKVIALASYLSERMRAILEIARDPNLTIERDDLVTLEVDFDDLTRLAYFECTLEVEGLKSHRKAVIRTLEIKDIQENNTLYFLHYLVC